MYIIHEEFQEFLDVVALADSDAPVYIQTNIVMAEPASRALRTGMYVTAAVSDAVVHAAHLRIESALLFSCQWTEEQVRESMIRRLSEARQCVEAAFHAQNRATMCGMALVPGLLDDIKRFNCSHALWSWEDDQQQDVMARRLRFWI